MMVKHSVPYIRLFWCVVTTCEAVRTMNIGDHVNDFTLTVEHDAKKIANDGTLTADHDIQKIICPFLSTMINENALPVQQYYSADQFIDFLANAGVPYSTILPHVNSQFRRIYTNKMDIFNMEGLPNEHVTSTGITDCETDYTDYRGCSVTGTPDASPGGCMQGVRVCPTADKNCNVNDTLHTDAVLEHFSPNSTNISVSDFKNGENSFRSSPLIHKKDINIGAGVLGTISGSFGLTIIVLTGGSETISKEDLKTVLLHRKFPSTYTFNQKCASTNIAPSIRIPFGKEPMFSFQFSIQALGSGQYVNLVGDNDALSFSSEASLWAAQWEATITGVCPSHMKYRLRSSDSGKYMFAFISEGNYEIIGKELSADVGYWWCVEPGSRDVGQDNNVVISSAYLGESVTLGASAFWLRYCDRPI